MISNAHESLDYVISSTSKKISRSMNMTRQSSKRVSPNLFLFLVLTEAIVEYPFNTSRVNHIIQCVSNLFEQALLRGQQDSQGL